MDTINFELTFHRETVVNVSYDKTGKNVISYTVNNMDFNTPTPPLILRSNKTLLIKAKREFIFVIYDTLPFLWKQDYLYQIFVYAHRIWHYILSGSNI